MLYPKQSSKYRNTLGRWPKFLQVMLRPGEYLFVAFFIMLATSAFIPLWVREDGMGFLDSIKFQLWFIVNFAVSVSLLILRWPRFLKILAKGKYLWMMMGLVLLSFMWSDSSKTLQKSIELFQTTIFGAYIATRYSMKEQIRLYNWVFAIAAILSLVYIFVLPRYGITQGTANAGKWRGIFIHKNVLGRMMTIGGILGLIQAYSEKKNLKFIWLGTLVSIYLLYACDSKTALVSFIFIVAMAPLHKVLRWNAMVAIPLYIIVLLLGIIGVSLFVTYYEDALYAIDKDPDLNGRVPLWKLAIKLAGNRPWLGFGYGGFWRGWQGEEHAIILRSISWEPEHAHNGFLDIFTDFGYIGFSLFMVAFVVTMIRAITWIRVSKSTKCLWPLGYLTYIVLFNVVQDMFMLPQSIYWVLYVTIHMTPIEEEEDPPPKGEPPMLSNESWIREQYKQSQSVNRT